LDYRAKDGTGEAPWPLCLESSSLKNITCQYHGNCFDIDANYMTCARLSTVIPPILPPAKAPLVTDPVSGKDIGGDMGYPAIWNEKAIM
jgi:hypothetical protein